MNLYFLFIRCYHVINPISGSLIVSETGLANWQASVCSYLELQVSVLAISFPESFSFTRNNNLQYFARKQRNVKANTLFSVNNLDTTVPLTQQSK